MKSNPHHIFSLPKVISLAICLPALGITLFFLPFSMTYLAIALAVGILYSVISIEELTGGLSALSIPILVIGQSFASDIAFGNVTGSRQLIPAAQFLAIVLSTDAVVAISFRSHIETFCNRKFSRRT